MMRRLVTTVNLRRDRVPRLPNLVGRPNVSHFHRTAVRRVLVITTDLRENKILQINRHRLHGTIHNHFTILPLLRRNLNLNLTTVLLRRRSIRVVNHRQLVSTSRANGRVRLRKENNFIGVNVMRHHFHVGRPLKGQIIFRVNLTNLRRIVHLRDHQDDVRVNVIRRRLLNNINGRHKILTVRHLFRRDIVNLLLHLKTSRQLGLRRGVICHLVLNNVLFVPHLPVNFNTVREKLNLYRMFFHRHLRLRHNTRVLDLRATTGVYKISNNHTIVRHLLLYLNRNRPILHNRLAR